MRHDDDWIYGEYAGNADFKNIDRRFSMGILMRLTPVWRNDIFIAINLDPAITMTADLISSIYTDVMTPGSMPILMAKLGSMFDANCSFMFTSHSNSEPEAILLGQNIAAEHVDSFRTYWNQEDIWARAASKRGMMKRNVVVRGSDLVPLGELQRSRFYNDFARECGMCSMLGSVLFDGSEGSDLPFTNLCWYRAAGQDDFGPEDVRKLRYLLPHIQHALALARQITALKYQGEVERLASSMPGVAWLLLDGAARIVTTNAVAAAALNKDGGLLKTAGNSLRRLGERSAPPLADAMAYCSNNQAAIRLLICQCGQPQLIKGSLMALPVEADTEFGHFDDRRYLLLLQLPQDDRGEIVIRAGELYGYTLAEQRVVHLLLDGLNAEQIARERCISINTIRTQLQSILAKGGFARQVDLVNQLSRLTG